MTTTKKNDQKKEIQDKARRVGLLLKEYDSLWTEQGWSSARTLQEDTSRERGTDDLDLDVFDVRPRQEPQTNQNQVQETSDRHRQLRRHLPPLLYQRHCGQKSHDPNHVRTKRNTDEHVVANVARTQKGR